MKKLLLVAGSIAVSSINLGCSAPEREVAAADAATPSVQITPDIESRVPAGPVSANSPRRRYGIGMAPPRGGEPYLTVLMVADDGVAVEAGVQTNDRITHVNGIPVSQLTPEAFTAAMRGSPLTLSVDRGVEKITIEMTLDDVAAAQPPSAPSLEEAAGYRDAARQLANLLEQRYLFADVGAAYASVLRANADAGRYAKVASQHAFAEGLTADLASVSRDEHLRVLAGMGSINLSGGSGSDPASLGIADSGWLNNKVAFMRISQMPETPAAQEWADAFMRKHASADALILDLRRCIGGTLAMMNGFLPYLYDTPTHLLTMEMRPGADSETKAWLDSTPELTRVQTDDSVDRWEHWVSPNESAKPDMPVYVLTDLTASACEHLTAALKVTERATVIGGKTRGAGHFVAFHEFGDGYSVVLPVGRTYDPATGDGWEGAGILPHIAVDPADAEAEALRRITKSK